MNEAMFEINLDTYLCYVTNCKKTAIESWYLKPIFKNEKNNMDIWKAIVLELKSLIYFLKNESYELRYLYQLNTRKAWIPIL